MILWRAILFGLFLCASAFAGGAGFLLPYCAGYEVSDVPSLSAALAKTDNQKILEHYALLPLPKITDETSFEKGAEIVLARALLALRNKNSQRLRESAESFLRLKNSWPADVIPNSSFGNLCRVFLLLKSAFKPEERTEAENWLMTLSNQKDSAFSEKINSALLVCRRALLASQSGRGDVVSASLSELSNLLSSVNDAGLLTGEDLAAQLVLLGALCEVGEVSISAGRNLFLLRKNFSSGETSILAKMGATLASCYDTRGLIGGRGWYKDAALPPQALCSLALRCRLFLGRPDSVLTALYGAKENTLSPPRLFSPAGSGLLFANSRVKSGSGSRHLRLVTVQGGRFGDLLALYLNGAGRAQMGITASSNFEALVGKEYYTHTIASPTVTINQKKQKPAAARLLANEQRQGLTFISADGRDAYPELSEYRRDLLFTDDYCLDIFSLKGETGFTAEWALQTQGNSECELKGTTAPEQSFESRQISQSFLGGKGEPAYALIEDVSSQLAQGQWSCDFKNGLKTIMMGQGDTRVLTGKVGGKALRVGKITSYRVTDGRTLIVRRENVKETRFAALHELYAERPIVSSIVRLEVGDDLLVFEIVCGNYLDYVVFNPALKSESFPISEKRRLVLKGAQFGFLRLEKNLGVLLQNFNLDFSEEENN